MSRSIILSTLWFAGWALYLLKAIPLLIAPEPQPPPSGSPVPWCGAPGIVVSDIVAENQARRAFGEVPFAANPLALYSLSMVDGGFLVRLGPRLNPRSISLDGGGGLAWVDGSTGCVTVLR
jgi:hypothetical protein